MTSRDLYWISLIFCSGFVALVGASLQPDTAKAEDLRIDAGCPRLDSPDIGKFSIDELNELCFNSTPAEPLPAPPAQCQSSPGADRVIGVADDDVLNIRKGPSARTQIVGVIPPYGTGINRFECQPVDGYRRDWCRVEWKCTIGWVYSRFITGGAEAEDFYRITGVESWDTLMSAPSLARKVVFSPRSLRMAEAC